MHLSSETHDTIISTANKNPNKNITFTPNTNTTTKTTFGQWLTKDDKWIPLKISWLCKLTLEGR